MTIIESETFSRPVSSRTFPLFGFGTYTLSHRHHPIQTGQKIDKDDKGINGLSSFKKETQSLPKNQDERCDCYERVLMALRLGYRLIDTAVTYKNEKEVGRAINDFLLESTSVGFDNQRSRESIFVSTKISPAQHGQNIALNAIRDSLSELNLSYIDAVFIHWPGVSGVNVKDQEKNKLFRLQTYDDMIMAKREGLIKYIGVSNYTIDHLNELYNHLNIWHTKQNENGNSTSLSVQDRMTPDIIQCEIHPFFPQTDLINYCKELGIEVQGYSSLGQGLRPFLQKKKGTENNLNKIKKIKKKKTKAPKNKEFNSSPVHSCEEDFMRDYAKKEQYSMVVEKSIDEMKRGKIDHKLMIEGDHQIRTRNNEEELHPDEKKQNINLVLQNPIICEIAKTKNWTPAQVCLVWSRQHDVSTLVSVGSSPASSHTGYTVASASVFTSTTGNSHATSNEAQAKMTQADRDMIPKEKLLSYQQRMNENISPYICNDCNRYILYGEKASICIRKASEDKINVHCRYRMMLSEEEMNRIDTIHLFEGCNVKYAWDPREVK